MTKILKGITWDHSRALPPLVAAAQRYEELNPGVRILWEKRTLHEFGHMPIDALAPQYDLVVIDHPWAAFCFNRGLVLDLGEHLAPAQRAILAANCIGPSFESYLLDGKLLAIPIDAATPVPSWRQDLMEERGLKVPRTWEELAALADKGQAVMPGFTADLFLNWLMLLHAVEAEPFVSTGAIALKVPALEAMDLLKRLAEPMPPEIFSWNPIAIAERLTREDRFAYCAFAYSYNNYARPSFVSRPLHYGNLVELEGRPLRSIVGGTGMAVSSSCDHADMAVDFACYCASAEVQSGLYALSGGQPARREAWESPELDRIAGGFFSGTRDSHENSILRPRYDGYVPLQEQAGEVLQLYLKGEIPRERAWQQIQAHYLNSL